LPAKLIGTMTDIYVRAGKHDKVETITQNLRLNSVLSTILIKSFGMADKADKATIILKSMLSDPEVNPTIETFGTVMKAWAESSRPDALEEAFAILQLMNTEPKCMQLNIQPNTIIFNALLKCLSKSSSKDAGQKAVEIFCEMERRYLLGDDEVKPDITAYIFAMKTCLRVGDADRAERLMDRMEKSDRPPNIVAYCDILSYWSRLGTPEAAERAERILMHMKQLAKTKNPDVKPEVFAYTIVMNAWSKSGHSESGERVWRLYEQMKAENIKPSIATFNTLIVFLSTLKDETMLKRAESLLQLMEKSERPDLQPDFRQFNPVIKGWLSIDSVEDATRVLLRFSNSPAKPNIIMMNMVVNGWIKNRNLDRAMLLVAKMQELKDANVLPEGPNYRTYRHLLYGWKKFRQADRPGSMQELKDRVAALESGK